MLIINADDWGMKPESTNNALICYKDGRITSVSTMMFMEDSERSAELALEIGLDVGLHLNFTERFNGRIKSTKLQDSHQRIATFLLKNKYSLLLYNPMLKRDFEYVYKAQYDEYVDLYERVPTHIDGHHHMHLCTNVLIDKLVPENCKIRRSYSYNPGEKGLMNRSYRHLVYTWLKRRYVCTDFFFIFSQCHGSDRLNRIVELSQSSNIELMVHPDEPEEYKYLMSTEYLEIIRGANIGTYEAL